MKRSLTIIIFIIIINVINSQSAFAVESSGSAKTKLQALQAEIASKAALLKQEIGNKLQNKVYSGFIKSKSLNSLTLGTPIGSKIVNVNEYTIYQSDSPITKKTSNQSTLLPEDFVFALGDVDDTGVLTAKKVIKTATPSAARQTYFGEVQDINEENKAILMQTKQGQNLTLQINSATVFKMGSSEALISDVRVQKSIIAVGIADQKLLKARFIYIFPYSSGIKVKTASPSASPKEKPATTSGKKKL